MNHGNKMLKVLCVFSENGDDAKDLILQSFFAYINGKLKDNPIF